MQGKAILVFKACLTQCDAEKQKALERFLPEHTRHSLQNMPAPLVEIEEKNFSHDPLLQKVHWSWFLPTLKTYPESEQTLFLSVFPSSAKKNLAKTLTLSTTDMEITPMAKAFLKKTLLDSLIGPREDLLPIPYLPSSPLNRLLTLTKNELTRLIDRLSLYDLSLELRQIVETKILKKIYSFLTEAERKALEALRSYRENFPIGKQGFEKWDGSEESLRTSLHKKGLARLGVGLSGQEADLIWYICHQLDIGRGSALHKLCNKEPMHGATEMVIKQIESL